MSTIKELRTASDYAGIFDQLAPRIGDIPTGEVDTWGPTYFHPSKTRTFILSSTEVSFRDDKGEEFVRFTCKNNRWLKTVKAVPKFTVIEGGAA